MSRTIGLSWIAGLVFIINYVSESAKGSEDQCKGWPGSQYFDGFCYKLITDQVSWDTAKLRCQDETEGGHLAEGTTFDRLQFMREIAMFDTSLIDIWIGGKVEESGGTPKYQWDQDGTIVDYLSWDTGYPTYSSTTGGSPDPYCVVIANEPGWRMLATESCALNSFMFICQKAVGNPCDQLYPGGVYYDKACYTYNSRTTNFHDAQVTCERTSATLAEPRTQDLHDFLRSFMDTQVHNKVVVPENTQVSVTSAEVNMQFKLAFSVRACQGATLKLWASGDYTEYYAFMLGGDANNQLQLTHHKQSFADGFRLLDSVTRSGVLSCGEAKSFNVYWWGFDALKLEDVKEQFALEYDFRSVGSAVISIDTATLEMDSFSGEWVLGDRDTQAFIGATDEAEEGTFRWVSNDLELDNMITADWWNPNEPNNIGTDPGEDYIVIKGINSGFNDAGQGNFMAAFICQKTIFRYTHVLVVPQLSSTSTSFRNIRVTSIHNGDVTVDWSLLNYDVIESGSMITFQGRQDYLDLRIPSDYELGESGIFNRTVMLMASQEITAVLTIGNSNTKDSVLLFPTHDLRTHIAFFVVTSGGELDGTDQVVIVSLSQSNRISIVFSDAYSESVELTHSGMTYKYPVSGDVVLDRYQTLVIQSEADLTGTLVTGSDGIIVLAGTHNDKISGGSTLDGILPTAFLGTEYFTIPSYPTDPTQDDTFIVLAVYDETTISIPGYPDIWLPSSGDSRTVTLPRYDFHYMTSSLPFYANKLGRVDTSGVCQTTLFPPNLWRSEYSAHVYTGNSAIVFVVEASALDNNNILADSTVLGPSNLDCRNVTGTTKVGCMMRFSSSGAHVLTSVDSTSFPAYLINTVTGASVKCHPLGLDLTLPIGNPLDFDPDEYLESQRCPHVTVNTTSTPTDSSTDTTVDSTTAATPTTITTTAATTVATTATATAAVTAAPTNLTQSQIEEATKKIQEELTVSYRNTSSFKRSKTSATDTRASSAALGASGIFFMVSVFAFVSLSDVISFMHSQIPHVKDGKEDRRN